MKLPRGNQTDGFSIWNVYINEEMFPLKLSIPISETVIIQNFDLEVTLELLMDSRSPMAFMDKPFLELSYASD